MAKDLEISMLYDFYGDLLTEKQQEVIELYYNEDLSLAEIAAHSGITRQGVLDIIKRSKQTLIDYEEKLQLIKKFGDLKEIISHFDEKVKADKNVLELVEYIDNL